MTKNIFFFCLFSLVLFAPIPASGAEPSFKLDCPFFLKWSADWETCVVKWNTFYGLTITLIAISIVIAAIIVAIWKIYKIKKKNLGS